MPTQVSLPLKVSTPLAIARVQIESVDADESGTLTFDDLAARYSYDGMQHVLHVDGLRYGQSHLQAHAQLHARNLTVSAQLAAALRDLVPDTPFAMLVRLQISGTLAGGENATVDAQLDARQQPHDAPRPDTTKLLTELATLRTSLEDATSEATPAASEAQILAQTTIHPWRRQPLQKVLLQVNRLDTHAFHVSAPVTAFRGRTSLEPVVQWRLGLGCNRGSVE